MIIQIDPPLELATPKGPAIAHFLIDYSIEGDLYWVCFQNNTGECWTWNNKDVRAQKNITLGRDYISPFYKPEDVGFKKNEVEVDWISVQESRKLDITEDIVRGDVLQIIALLQGKSLLGYDRLYFDGYDAAIYLYKSTERK